jgi:hypothetical protein
MPVKDAIIRANLLIIAAFLNYKETAYRKIAAPYQL